MTLPDLSVRRPVFATVAAVILCVIGIAAFFVLPVRELPNVDPPQVSIQTAYRGASAEVVEERITEVIERQVSSIEGIDRVQSQQPRRPLADRRHLPAQPQARRRRQRRARRGLPRGRPAADRGRPAADRQGRRRRQPRAAGRPAPRPP